MIFSEVILKHLGKIFNNYNFKIVEQRRDFIEVQSKAYKIIIVHNQFENSNTLWLGVNDKDHLVEINNDCLDLYFHSKLKLSGISLEDFVENLRNFFQLEGKSIFGNTTRINKLVEFDDKRSEDYTHNLLYRQLKESADTAWENKDYSCFINILDDIDHKLLPSSFKLKYKIAQNKK